MNRKGFTLLEMLLAVAILVVVSTVTYLTFSTVAMAWKKGMKLTDGIHHADYVLDQLCMGLRSAYYPDATSGEQYGFWLEDNGDGEYAADRISWVKLGYSLVGRNCRFAGTPHRVEFTLGEEDSGRTAASVRAWRILGQVEDFDPDEDIEAEFMATGMTGFNCRPMDPESDLEEQEQEVEWLDEWEDTNRIPTAVELTLYMEPLAEGEPPVEISRLVMIPVAGLSWQRRLPAEDDNDDDKTGDTPGGTLDGTTRDKTGGTPGGTPGARTGARTDGTTGSKKNENTNAPIP